MMTLLVLSSILIVTLAAAQIISSGIVMSRTQERSTKAFFAAEAGAERSLWEVRKNYFALPPTDQSAIFTGSLSNSTTYSVDYATSSPNVTFYSAGLYLGTKRTIQLDF